MSICFALDDANWTLTKDVFSIIGTLVSAAGVGLAFYIGLAGLSTWRRQLKGVSDHELSRKALIELYRYREAIERARSPAMLGYEVSLTSDEAAELSFQERNHLGKQKGYNARFERISKAREPIHSTLLDSEAVWGKQFGELVRPLFQLQYEFWTYVECELIATDPKQDDDYRKAYREIIKDRRNVMFDDMDDVGDEFRQEFNGCLNKAESYLKEKLLK